MRIHLCTTSAFFLVNFVQQLTVVENRKVYKMQGGNVDRTEREF